MLIDSEDEWMVMAKLRFTLTEALSVTAALKLNAPAVDGVPVMEPSTPRDNPAGAEPLHRYGGVPPEADRFCEYATPTVPSGSGEVVVITSEDGLMVIVKLRFAVTDALSVTVAVKEKDPAVKGVPVSEPLESKDSPAGGEPDQR